MNNRKNTGESSKPVRKRLWPWVTLLIIVVCLVYSYDRIGVYLEENAEELPFMFLDFVFRYFFGDPLPPGTTAV